MVRRLAHVLVVVVTLIVGATAAAVIVSQTAWFKDWLRGYIERSAAGYLNGTLSIGRLGGNLFFGVELENVAVTLDGQPAIAIQDVGLDYNALQLIASGLSLDAIRLNHPVIHVRRTDSGWSLTRLIRKQETEADRQGPDRPVSIDAIGISGGTVVVDGAVGTSGVAVPRRFEQVDAKLSFRYEPVRYSIGIDHVSFRGEDPALPLNAMSGGIAVRDDTLFVDRLAIRTAETSLSVEGSVRSYLTEPVFNLHASSDKLSLPELAKVIPSLNGIAVQPKFELKVNGPLAHFGVEMNVQSSAGEGWTALVADLESPGQSVSGTVSVRHLNLAPLLSDASRRSDITADARIDLRGESLTDVHRLSGTASVSAKRVAALQYEAGPVEAKARVARDRLTIDARGQAYGAAATAAGLITLDGTPSVDLRGRVARLNLHRLPASLKAPAATTDLNAAYRVAGTLDEFTADVRFDPSSAAGATIEPGGTATIVRRRDAIAYRADATIAAADPQRLGREFGINALATDRFAGTLNGRVAAAGSIPPANGAPLDLAAYGTLNDSTIFGATVPVLTFDVTVKDDTAHVNAQASVAGMDPAVVLEKEAARGQLTGTFDVDATVAHVSSGVTPDAIEGTARATLGPSAIGDVRIDRAVLDADSRGRTAAIRSLDVVGRDFNAHAAGTLALNDEGASNLTVHADSPSLAAIGAIIDQPIAGIAKVDATVTGNRSALAAKGTLTANGFTYRGQGTLTAISEFSATVPELDIERASASAATHATFVTVAGQNVNELDAKTEYVNGAIQFDATAKQPQRSLASAGSLELHADHREIHLRNLNLESKGVRWQTPQGVEATIRYGNDALAVDRLRLVNGAQQIDVDGGFGRSGDVLNVVMRDIDVATVDALLLREPQLTGTLSGRAAVTGSMTAPVVAGEFAVERGGFRQFRYDRLGGTAKWADEGVEVDARLQQNASTWMTVKGYAPLSDRASRGQYDLHVDSSAIDLGLVQGFTSAVTKVTGSVQATVDITGAAGDPRPNGAVTIANGALTVPATGVSYSGISGRADLRPDAVHIERLHVLDEHQRTLDVSGDLAIREREVGDVAIAIDAHDFEVVDNDTGHVRLDSKLRIAGQLNAPRIEGDLGITTGRINLDPILAAIGESAYATQAESFTTTPATPGGTAAAPSSSFYDALYAFVHVTVPNDLVVKANDLKAPGAPVGFGSLNVTLGGDVTVHKAPWDQPRIYGAVNTVRGTYDFQGRRFDILRDGSVRFEGTDEIDPTLDIRTERVIQAVTASVGVRGTLSHPAIALSSVPPLEEADILALVIFNQPINQLGEGAQASLAERAQSMALGAATGQLSQAIGNALNLDTFELTLSPESGASELTIGEQLGRDLYLKVEQGLGDQNQTNFILEYELTSWLRFRTNVTQGASSQALLFRRVQGSGADLLFFFGF